MAARKFNPKGDREIELDLGGVSEKQELFINSKTLYTAFGGSRGGGKSHVLRIKAIKSALEYDGIRILIVRRAYKDVEENHVQPILQKVVPLELASYKGDTYTLTFINGSVIKFGHYQGAHSDMEYQGKEYDLIFLDEATQFTEREFLMFGACCRGVNKFPKQIFLTCNPGGVGHLWVKRLFIDKQYKTDSDNPEENEDPTNYTFIPATVEDNTAMRDANPQGYQQYLHMLSSLPEEIRAAHRYGDWSAMGGNYFPEFSDKTHVIRRHTFKYPSDWRQWNRYRAIDYGYDMLACYWIAVSPDNRSYVYREVCAPNLNASEAAQTILSNTLPSENIITTFIPPDMWKRSQIDGKTVADVLLAHNISITRANNDLFQGGMQVKEFLMLDSEGRPGIYFFDNCPLIIKHLAEIQCDEKDPNKYSKVPHDITHQVDAIRYYCISRTMPTVYEPEPDFDDDDDEYVEEYDDYMRGGEPSMSYINS